MGQTGVDQTGVTALLGTIRKNIVELATMAATVRNQYLSGSGKSYEPEFHQFWKTYSMENKFGSLSTFAKYANIGDAIEKVRARYERYQDRLPTTMTALYEFSQLEDDELELCLEDHWVRTEITSDKDKWKRKGRKPIPVISPSATAAAIRTWRTHWRNLPRQRLLLLRPGLGQLSRHRAGRHVAVELLQHLHRRAHVAGQHVVVDALV